MRTPGSARAARAGSARRSGGAAARVVALLACCAVAFVLLASQQLAQLTVLEQRAEASVRGQLGSAFSRASLWSAAGRAGGGAGATSSATVTASTAAAAPLPAGAAEERACSAMLARTSRIMFMIIGGRGYHAVRVKAILGTWARCVRHALVFTDPSANVSGYLAEPRRYVYLASGDAWRKRPYLPMTHMDTIGRLLSKAGSPAADVQWYFLVTDRTFVDVPALLSLLPALDPRELGYHGQVANSTLKEAFGFRPYVDLNTGVLLSATLLTRVVDPASCKDQKGAAGTFDMFDAKLGNCAFFLGAQPQTLPGFSEATAPQACEAGGGVGGVVSYGKVEPRGMARLACCAGLLSQPKRDELAASVGGGEAALRPEQVPVHVMARETDLRGIIGECEETWAAGLPRVYYHAMREVAAEHYRLSPGRYGVSGNIANTSAAPRGRHAPAPAHRIAALSLPERPGGGAEHWTVSHDKGLTWNTWLRFKMKAIFEWSVRAPWSELGGSQWYVYVDDDTYLLHGRLLKLLRKYDPAQSHYFGRPLQEEGFPTFVGGGAGIILSRGGALAILSVLGSVECDPLNLKWADRTHQGGDAWLGDCAEVAGVTTDMEYGFYPQPPVANLFHLFDDAVSFHGVQSHRDMQAALAAADGGKAGERYDPRCVPVFVNHRYTCLPHFVIGGVPKAGTTSLYKYLMQHPEVLPAADKELTFWGNFFTPKRRPGREEVTTDYLSKFPLIRPEDFKVTGEATPGYLYCITCPTYILKYLPKVRFLFSLRNPVVRAYSEYLNKVVDQTVMRYLNKRVDTKMDKELTSYAPPFAQLVDDVAKTMESCPLADATPTADGRPTGHNRTFSMMDEYDDESDAAHCYVNPFVGEGRYAKYLRLWLDIVPSEQIMLLNFDEWTADAAATMRSVADFLMLGPHVFRVEEAHNTHLARSVHVAQHASSNASAVAADSIEEGMSFATHCVLHEFFRPYQQDLTALLREYGYPPMEWDTGRKGGYSCPSAYRHWKHLRGNAQ